jgi:adenine-specific DNA-methyltransferase
MNFIQNESEQKLRGGYYTPLDLAVYISQWVLEKNPKTILEPSCGDGIFIEALQSVELPEFVKLTGFELLADEAKKARTRSKTASSVKATVHTQDFLDWAIPQMGAQRRPFDAVVGNPPFIRYQYLPEDSQKKAHSIFEMLGLPFTKHTNAWVPFILASIALLKSGGRLGMIIPSEILHVAHAQSLRTYLGNSCSRLLIIDPEEIWFEGTLQGAVILLAEKKTYPEEHSDGLGIVRVNGRQFLNTHASKLFDKTPRMNGKTVVAKWTQALLTDAERSLIDELCARNDVHRFKDIAKVDVGIVTGANDFFLVNDATVAKFGLQQFSHPMFGRSEHCPGIIYDERQHDANAEKGSPTNFIWFKDLGNHLSKSVLSYIKAGEAQELHARYKCRIRKPWYTVPSVYSTKVGMLKRSHDMPRLIHNRLGAYTTDTAYRISPKTVDAEHLIHSFMNSLTALSAELEGRHYGGGVLELVPSEIEKLIVPLPASALPDLEYLDALVRKHDVVDVLRKQDQKILGGLGLTKAKQIELLDAWLRLKSRRQRNSSEEINLSQS